MKKYFNQYRGLPRAIYILFFGRIVTCLGSMIWPMLTMIMSQKMGLSASEIAITMVVSGVVIIPANLLGGKLADHSNKKMVIVWCDTISIFFYIICAFLPLSFVTIAILIVASVCQQLEYPSYNALIADMTLVKDRERAYSLQYLGMNMGLILSPTIAGFLFRDYLWLAFVISGLAIAISTVLIYKGIGDVTPVEDTSEEAQYQAGREDVSIWQVIRENMPVAIFMLLISTYYAAYNMWGYLMPLDMGKIHGDDGAVIFGTVNSLNCIIVVVFTPIITKVFAKVVEPRRVLIGETMVGLGYLVFLLFRGHIPVYYLAILFFTWGEIFTTITEEPYITKRIPASHRGRLNGIGSVLGSVLFGIFELVVGYAYDHIGSEAAWTIVIAALALAAMLTIVLSVLDARKYPALYQAEEK